MRVPLTQKARGVIALKLYAPTREYVPEFRLVQSEEHAKSVRLGDVGFGRFCPPKPEHGYIESRHVKDREDLVQMILQTKQVHEQSEIMLMEEFEPDSLAGSFVWTPSKVTFGDGNDGATAGKKGCVTLPLVPASLPQELLDGAGVPKGQSPYVEGLVMGRGEPKLVQLRHGPEPPAALDFVPKTMKVEKVVKAEGDLMVFAELVKTLEAGTVVDHHGGSLTSHYGVHCLNNAVPIVCTFVPEVGTRIQQVEQKMPTQNPEQVAEWFCFGMRDARSRHWSLHDMGHACNAALWIMHNAAMLGERPELVGSALAILVKLCVIACHGEARHITGDPESGVSRPNVFRKRLQKGLEAVRTLPLKRELFEGMGTAPSGVGGQPWAHCASVTIDLVEMVRDLVQEPTTERLSAVLTQVNVVVNEAHNGGWWLNKFTSEEVFDACSAGSPVGAGYAWLGVRGILATVAQTKEKVRGRIVGFQRKKLLELPQMERRPVRIAGRNVMFFLHPEQGMLYAVGKRLGWRVKAPQAMIEDVKSGAVLPSFYRQWMYADNPVVEGGTALLTSASSMGPLCGEEKTYQVPWVGEEVFDARIPSEWLNEKAVMRRITQHISVLGDGKLELICEQCFEPKDLAELVELPFVCKKCRGEVEVAGGTKCKLCGKRAVGRMVVGASAVPLCWECVWEKAVALDVQFLVQHEAERAEYKALKFRPRVMCGGVDCTSSRELDTGAEYRCGCSGKKPSDVYLTLEKLKGLS